MASDINTTSLVHWQVAYLTRRRAGLVIALLCGLLLLAAILALALGSESISLVQLWTNTLSREQEVILVSLRLPRIALAIGSGAALALAGAAFQALLRNPLADPYVLGVSSGAALAQQPSLLLLDEPTANLALAHQLALLQLVTQLTRTHNLGALFVTHEINLAAEFADRVALLKDGTILACGPPNEVMTAELLQQVFGAPLFVTTHPQSGKPLITLTGTIDLKKKNL
jgi:hypothetical protein